MTIEAAGKIVVSGLAARNVLIVEDEWLVRMELVAAFEDENCAVQESASAEQAIALVEASRERGMPIDLLITDIRLTGVLTGWDLASEARTLDEGIAVVYVSANLPVADRKVPGSVFIDKPAVADQVVAAARRLLS